MSDEIEPATDIRVYEYGCRPPFENAERVREQMSFAHKYSNKLVEIERERRRVVREAQAAHADVAPLASKVAALEASLEEAVQHILKRRQATRTANTAVVDKQRVADLRKELKAARAIFREAKKATREDETLQAAIKKANDDAHAALKRERAVSGCHWGTYLMVEQAADQARKQMMEPKFKRWDGRGHVAVQIQNGLDTTDVYKSNTRIWIETVPERRDRILNIRVGSTEDRGPVFGRFWMKMSRELPPGKIKWVHVLRKRVADEERWFVQFVVASPRVSEAVARQDCYATASGSIGIDVGWRLMDDGGLRVAVGIDDKGERFELRLPARLVTKDEHVGHLQSIRSKLLDETKARFIADMPQVAANEHVHAWRSPGRFARLLKDHHPDAPPKEGADPRMGHEPIPEPVQQYIQAFLKQDRHLWRWQENERMAVGHRRREFFRQWALKIARNYRSVVIEDFDLRAFAKREKVEEGAQTDSRRYIRLRALACVSGFRDALVQACAKRRVEVRKAKAANTTLTCNVCKVVNADFDGAIDHAHTCVNCGAIWYQDDNAALNLLAVLRGDVETKNAHRGPVKKSERMTRLHAKRDATSSDTKEAAE